MIHTDSLTRRFGAHTAVDRLSLSVQQGEVFGFLGPNGAGKTTTVRMLAALIAPSTGNATVNGLPLGPQNDAIRRCVGVLTETPGLYDNLSAEYNLRLFAGLYEIKDPAGQVEKYLRMLGLWEQRYQPAGTFSKGMKQKLALARALLHEPAVLFLDEPTSGLDPEAAHLVREFILDLRRQGRTIFLCTHNLDEADRLCDRIAVFKTRLLAVDTPEALRRRLWGRRVVFHLRSASPDLPDLVRPLPGVQEASLVDGKLLVAVDDPEERNPAIIRALVAAGAEIQFVGELRRSLEDAYLALVSEQRRSPQEN